MVKSALLLGCAVVNFLIITQILPLFFSGAISNIYIYITSEWLWRLCVTDTYSFFLLLQFLTFLARPTESRWRLRFRMTEPHVSAPANAPAKPHNIISWPVSEVKIWKKKETKQRSQDIHWNALCLFFILNSKYKKMQGMSQVSKYTFGWYNYTVWTCTH